MFNDIHIELNKLGFNCTNWDRIYNHASLGTNSKPERNKFGKRNKSKVIKASIGVITTWVKPENMPKKASKPKFRTNTILADVIHKTKHY